MSIATLWPGARAPVLLVPRTITTVGGPSRISYGYDGDVTTIGGNVSPAVGVNEWLAAALQGAAAASGWEIQAQFISGDPLTGGAPTNVWRDYAVLQSNQFWEQDESGTDRITNLDIFVRRTSFIAKTYGPARVTLTSIAPTS